MTADGASFEPGPVTAGRRSPLIAASWIVAVVGLVAFAAGGHSTPTGPPAPTAPPVARGTSAPEQAPFAPGEVQIPFTLAVTTASHRVDVTGTLEVHAELVAVSLVTDAGRTAQWELLGVSNPDGEIRLDAAPPFAATFDVPASVMAHPLWVQVEAFDANGVRVAVMRRAVGTHWFIVLGLGRRQA